MSRPGVIFCVFGLLLACGCGQQNDGEAPQGSGDPSAPSSDTGAAHARGRDGPTRTEMRDVVFVVADDIALHIELLRGRLSSRTPGEPVVLDDPESYVLHIDTASTWIAYEDLGTLLNERIFEYEAAPLGGLEVRREDDEDQHDRIEVKGHLRHQLDLPFEMEGVPQITAEGEIRMRTSSMEVIGIGVQDLLDAFGAEVEDMIVTRESRGVRIEGDDMVLQPGRMLAPPVTEGTVSDVEVGAHALVMTFGGSGPARPASGPASSSSDPRSPTADPGDGPRPFISYRGGRVRLGKMTMIDTDIMILDDDPTDAFRFRPAEMNRQLVAGYAKLHDDGGLTIFAPDAP